MDSIPVTFMSCSKVCIPLTAPSAVYCPLSLFKRRDRSYTYIFEGFRTSNYNSMKYVVRNTWNSIIIIIFSLLNILLNIRRILICKEIYNYLKYWK